METIRDILYEYILDLKQRKRIYKVPSVQSPTITFYTSDFKRMLNLIDKYIDEIKCRDSLYCEYFCNKKGNKNDQRTETKSMRDL